MSSEGSDIELPSALPKKKKMKLPKSPTAELLDQKQEKKLTTKTMINQALIDLKTRKGVSMFAIKKYLGEKYNFDVDKNNYLIKKAIKSSVEDGTVVQTKGIGASGSFKLVATKEKKEKPKKKVKTKEKSDADVKPEKPKKIKIKNTKNVEGKVTKKTAVGDKKPKAVKQIKDTADKGKKSKAKIAKGLRTPAKTKAALMKRKSIGSIIKPPKMKPKAKA